jgi:hypothetical protein
VAGRGARAPDRRAHRDRAGPALKSEGAKEGKSMAIMDVSAAAVERAFAESGCPQMIHGHTHRPARHVHRVGGGTACAGCSPTGTSARATSRPRPRESERGTDLR